MRKSNTNETATVAEAVVELQPKSTVIGESPEERYTRVQRELAEEEKSKQVPIRPVECDNKLNVPPPPPPGKTIRGSGMTYRRAIERGLITHDQLPVGMPIDGAYEPPAPMVAALPQPQKKLSYEEIGEWQRSQRSAEATAPSRSQCPHCGANIVPGVAFHRLAIEEKSPRELEVVSNSGGIHRICVVDAKRTVCSGWVSRAQLKAAGLL